MWQKGRADDYGAAKFFRIVVGDESLENYYKTNFNLMYHQKFSLTEMENMIPYEREVYLLLLTEQIQKENEEYEKAAKR